MNNKIIFITVTIGILFWIVLLGLGSFTIFMPAQKDTNLPYYLPVILENAHGIQQGTRVNILGVDQGYIKLIDYFPVDKEGNFIFISECKDLCKEITVDQVILVIINIRKKLDFYNNYRLYTRYDNVIGEKVIEIDPGSKYSKKNNKTIENQKIEIKYLDINELFNLISNEKIILNKNKLLQSTNYDDPVTIIAYFIYENRQALREIFKNTADITYKINRGKGTISLLINENTLLSNSDATLLEGILLVKDIREILESLRENNVLSKALYGTSTVILP